VISSKVRAFMFGLLVRCRWLNYSIVSGNVKHFRASYPANDPAPT
jgi:hypothetical protein